MTSSVIVTVKNDAQALQQLCTDLEAQSSLPTEVIIAVAASEDASLQVAEAWKPGQVAVTVLPLAAEATRSVGRNAAVDASTGELLVFTDAGCRLSAEWLKDILHAHSQSGADLISGFTRGRVDTPQFELQTAFTLVPRSRIEHHPLPATRNMAVTRKAWDEIGPFRADLNFAEDYEWSRRARQLGYDALFVPEAVVTWQPRENIWEFCRMVYLLTKGDLQANTIRWGHATLLARYLVFIGLAALASGWQNSWVFGVFTLFTVWFLYILVKATRFRLHFVASWFFYPWYQLLSDMAVLFGTLSGAVDSMYTRTMSVQRENT